MRTASQISAQIDGLREALGGGALSVEYQGRKVTYRSLREMREAIGVLESELADLLAPVDCNPRPPKGRRYASFRRGYHGKVPT